jgi:putative FmdB family regulatory protein
MPIFEYRCNTCDCCFEKLVLSKSDQKIKCPQCSGTKVTKLISAVNCRSNGIPTGGGGFDAPGCSPTGGG